MTEALGALGATAEVGRAPVEHHYLPCAWPRRALKRTFDILLSLLGLLFGAPLFVVAAILIKLDSPGPVFFRQPRVGRRRKPFTMWKFRKMREGLKSQGPGVTARYDMRLTRVGALLERTKLDELPQLINVLAGSMSVIGPRPELAKFVESYPEQWDAVLSVKPGLFGPNQLTNRNESELYPPGCQDVEAYYVRRILPDKLKLDADYARHFTLSWDLVLTFRCLWVALAGAVTKQTILTRRRQILSLAALWVAGVGGMALAHVATRQPLNTDTAILALVLAAVAKPLCLLALGITKPIPSSMAADDFVRLFWCAASSAALIVVGLYGFGKRDIGRLVLALDSGFFLAVLFVHKLLLYRVYFLFYLQESQRLARRMIFLSIACAAGSLSLAAVSRWGARSLEIQSHAPYLTFLVLAVFVRPSILLLHPPQPRSDTFSWLTREAPRVWLGTLVGSCLMVLFGLLMDQRDIGRGDILLDAVLYGAIMTALGVYANRRLSHRGAAGAANGQPPREHLLLIGETSILGGYISTLTTLQEHHYVITGLVTPQHAERTNTVGGYPILGEVADLRPILEQLDVDKVVVLTEGLQAGQLETVRAEAGRRACPCVEVDLTSKVRLPSVRA